MDRIPVRLRRRGARPAPAEAGPHVACNAPFTSMYLDQRGWVRACCMNDTHTLGNVADEPLSAIWHGERLARLRAAIEVDDLRLGCDICKWQVDQGRPDLAFSRWFNELPTRDLQPEWPRMLELSVSNACNLQCAMCNGEWSSSIRSQREGLPPLPKVYGEAFFDDLAAFLPHLERIKFLGGEPFLASETLRVMEMAVEQGLTPRCHVTTNGTQWSPRVERILEMLPVDVAVSLDAATAETYESIRIGSSWSVVQRNLDRFQEVARRRGTAVTVTYCLMATNWHEFLDFCRAADERGIGCAVNVVSVPQEMSLYFVAPDELARIVDALDAQDRESGGDLTLSASIWAAEVERLRAHLESRRQGVPVVGIDVRASDEGAEGPAPGSRPRQPRPPELEAEAEALRAAHLPAGTGRLRVDAQGTIVEVVDGPVLDLGADQLLGRSVDDITEAVGAAHGLPLHSHVVVESDAAQVVEVAFPKARRMVVVTAPIVGDDGSDGGRWLDVAWAAAPAPA